MSKDPSLQCLECDGPLTFLILCEKCQAIVPVGGHDPYDRLGIAWTLLFSRQDLQTALRQRMMLVHPDRLLRASSQQALRAQQHTVSLNQAYQTLEDPYERALCLSKKVFSAPLPPPQGNVLEEVFIWQDRLSQGTSETLALQNYISKTYEDLEKAFQTQNAMDAANHLARFRYLSKLLKGHQMASQQ